MPLLPAGRLWRAATFRTASIDVCDPLGMSCPYQLWLAAFDDQVPDRELYAYWNLKDEVTPTLDAVLGMATYLYVGSWSDEHEGEQPQAGLCPARRVFDWLYWRGTLPEFCAPVLSERLVEEILQCFAPRPNDLQAPTADPAVLSSSLTAHSGFAVLPQESGPAA